MSTSAFSSLVAVLGNYTSWIVPFLFTLTVIVFFHELGHFLVARWCGIRVLVFSMGFGPEVAGFNDRHGTRWKISLIPLGGYVKFFGDDNEASVPDPAVLAAMSEEERRHSFFGQSVGRRAAVVVAGPLTNFILAVIVFAGVFIALLGPDRHLQDLAFAVRIRRLLRHLLTGLPALPGNFPWPFALCHSHLSM